MDDKSSEGRKGEGWRNREKGTCRWCVRGGTRKGKVVMERGGEKERKCKGRKGEENTLL